MSHSIRLLHFADIHIGMENYGRTRPESGLSSRVHDFLSRMDEMIDAARQREVDLVIFAGDAFKNRSPSPTFQREFAFRVLDLAERCPVVLLVGNHDLPSIEKRASSIEIYETLNVPNVILGREYATQVIETRRGPVLVATAPYPMRGHLLRDVDIPTRSTIGEIDQMLERKLDQRLQELAEEAGQYDMPRVLTGHFSVGGATFGSERSVMLGRDITVPLSTLDDPAWDYVALGHIHKHQCLTLGRVGAPPVVYAGSLERIDFGEERDPKGYIVADVERGRATWEFIQVAARPFVTLRVNVKGVGEPTRVVLDHIRKYDLADAIVRVIITADPETDLLLNDRDIHHAVMTAGANTLAVIQREVERPARMRLGAAPEGLLPDELLERYLLSKEVDSERIDLLLNYARPLFEADD